MFKSTKLYQTFFKKFILVALLIPLFSLTPHKEYYSLTKIVFNKNEKALQITMQVFTNDLELSLSKQYAKALELGTAIEVSEANQLIEQYLLKNFEIKINDNSVLNYHFLGKEYENDRVFFYLEIKNIEIINSITIRNSVLMETYPEQENIIKLNINKQDKSLFLTSNNDKGKLKF